MLPFQCSTHLECEICYTRSTTCIFLGDQFLIWVVKETTPDRVQRQAFESHFFVVAAFVTLAKVLNFSVSWLSRYLKVRMLHSPQKLNLKINWCNTWENTSQTMRYFEKYLFIQEILFECWVSGRHYESHWR